MTQCGNSAQSRQSVGVLAENQRQWRYDASHLGAHESFAHV